jgi:hypothetical protein
MPKLLVPKLLVPKLLVPKPLVPKPLVPKPLVPKPLITQLSMPSLLAAPLHAAVLLATVAILYSYVRRLENARNSSFDEAIFNGQYCFILGCRVGRSAGAGRAPCVTRLSSRWLEQL